MFQNNPKLSLSDPFPLTDIIEAANHIWNVNRFDDDASSDDDRRTSADEASDSEEEEEMAQILQKEQKKLKKETKAKLLKPEAPAPTYTDATSKDTEDIADLIDKLGELKINDPKYPAMYFRVIIRAPQMIPFLEKPSTRQTEIPTLTGPSGPIRAPAASSQVPQASNGGTCYFCGQTGHGVRRCSLCENMISAGSIVRNDQGRITWPDGSNIARAFNENILTAVNRELASRTKTTNLIRATSTPQEHDPVSKDDYIIHNGQVFVAVRGKDTKAPRKEAHEDPKRRMIFDGIRLPQIPAASQKPTEPLAQEPRIVLPPPLATYEQPPAPFDPFDDDEIMEDISSDSSTDSTTFPVKKVPKKTKRLTKPNKKQPVIPSIPNDQSMKKEPLPKQQSELQQTLNVKSLIDKVLETPTTITLRELLGAAPMTSKKIQDYLRITRPSKFIQKEELVNDKVPERAQVNSVRESEYQPQDAKLIKLRLSFTNGHMEEALIDPGSEMDIMNQATWIKSQAPMTYTTRTAMRDAGDHLTSLDGRCDDLILKSGNLVTTSNFWVGNVPFPLLCGRPWQRRNKVNVEERDTGTWLVHRDNFDSKLWEICAVPSKRSLNMHGYSQDFFRQGHNHIHKTTFEEVTDKDT